MITEYKRKSFAFVISGLLVMVCPILIGYLASKVGNHSAVSPDWIPSFVAIGMVTGVVLLIFAVCYYAAAKGYSAVWGIFAFLFSCIGLLLLALLPDKTETDAPPPEIPFPKQAAKASLFAPLLSVFIGIVLQPQMQGNRIGILILSSISTLLLIVGFIFGIIALVATRRHGRAGIFGQALAGTLINGFFVLGMLLFILLLMTHHTDWLARVPSTDDQGTSHTINTFDKNGVQFSYYSDWEITEGPAKGNDASLVAIYGPHDSAVALAFFPPSDQETLEKYANRMTLAQKANIAQHFNGRSVDCTMESVVGRVGGVARAGFQSHFTVHMANASLLYNSYFFMLRDSNHKIMVFTQEADDYARIVYPGIELILNSIKVEGMAPAVQVRPVMAGTNAVKGGDTASLKVKMIIYKPKGACALIGNKTVMAGDVLEGFKIIAVEKDSLTVQSPAGVQKELRLGDVLK